MGHIQEEDYKSGQDSMFGSNPMDQIKDDVYASLSRVIY
jgi:hypothetical protein